MVDDVFDVFLGEIIGTNWYYGSEDFHASNLSIVFRAL